MSQSSSVHPDEYVAVVRHLVEYFNIFVQYITGLMDCFDLSMESTRANDDCRLKFFIIGMRRVGSKL